MQKMFKWFDEESRIAGCRKYTRRRRDTSMTSMPDRGTNLQVIQIPGIRCSWIPNTWWPSLLTSITCFASWMNKMARIP